MPDYTAANLTFTNFTRFLPAISRAQDVFVRQKIMERIWNRDYTVWSPEPDEISNRLGWLSSPQKMLPAIREIDLIVAECQRDGFTHGLLLGMGGSSLAPELYSIAFPKNDRFSLQVLDSTHPAAVDACRRRLDVSKTLFIVSTKSGGTEETLSFFKYFYNVVHTEVGPELAGNQFVAVTDQGSALERISQRYKFRKIFLNDPDIGGRFSAVTHFGLVPAAFCGIDLTEILNRAAQMASLCSPKQPLIENPAAILGITLAELAINGRDKLTFVIPPQLSRFGDWVEQLIAESTGKHGTGILPVVNEEIDNVNLYGSDRVFILLDQQRNHRAEDGFSEQYERLERTGQPLVRIPIEDVYDLAGQFFLWEMTTVIIGWRLKINPFDQPNVESAKARTREIINKYRTSGKLPELPVQTSDKQFTAYASYSGQDINECINNWISEAHQGDYLAIQAFLEPTPETDQSLARLRKSLTNITHLATTVGYGPRYLHSTGQLHKGDRGNGLFLLLTDQIALNIPIPDRAGEETSEITFDSLHRAQAMGDHQALREAGRRVLWLHIFRDAGKSIHQLSDLIAKLSWNHPW